jgi:hypothetical protein
MPAAVAAAPAQLPTRPEAVKRVAPVVPPVERRSAPVDPAPAPKPVLPAVLTAGTGEGGRNALLLEIRKTKAAFYNTVVAQAQRIEFGPDRVTFSFLPTHRALREQLEQKRQWLEQLASTVAGKRMTVVAEQVEVIAPAKAKEPVAARGPAPPKSSDLKSAAMADSTVQAMLDVFPAEIENVEEIE